MDTKTVQTRIEESFRKQVKGDSRLEAAFLRVCSDKLGVDIELAESGTGSPVHIDQPNHLASVGKLFTATLIAILFEQGKLDFNDRLEKHLDSDIMNKLHIYRGHDYSGEITIRNLLMQTSGLPDVFYNLWTKMEKDPSFTISTREAVEWGKANMKPTSAPGAKHHYTDTNYYLLGFIIEEITGKPFYEVMHEHIFNPLGMDHAYMNGFSVPKVQSDTSPAGLYIKGIDFSSVKGTPAIDHAGGSVVAPLSEYLIFMKALNGGKLIKKETLERMISDDVNMGFPTVGFDYGYSIWKFKNIPLLMPPKLYSWGCVGVTGAFMFYHPGTEAYIIGTFNNFAYRGKSLNYMAGKIIKELLKHEGTASP